MKQSCVGAFARAARTVALAAVATVSGVGLLLAQGGTGKIEGRVRDQAGAAIANAQVVIVGSAQYALSNPQGYYFINNVPAGSISIRASFIGYRPVEKVGVKVLAGQTITEDFSLEPAPIEVQPIIVTAEQPLVPRDKVTSKSRVDGDFADKLPIDNIGAVLRLQPGVTADNFGNLSIRGGRNNEATTYLDGVPVTAGYRGDRFAGSAGTTLAIATNGFEEVSVTSGSSSAEFGNAKSGIISVETTTGGPGYHGGLSYESDQPFGVNHSVGLNRLQGSFNGPLAGRLTFALSGELQGQKAFEEGFNSTDVPVFVTAGVDTLVEQAPGDTFAIMNYAIARGNCDQFANSTNPGIRDNYGVSCTGVRLPATARSTYRANGKLSYSYGTGSRVSLSAYSSRDQGHTFSNPISYNNRLNAPGNPAGSASRSNVVTLNLTQNLTKSTERALAVDLALSYQQDRRVDGPLTVASDADTRDPFGGFILSPMKFKWNFDNFPITDALVQHFQTNTNPRTPYGGENAYGSYPDQVRNNAYGLYGTFGGFVNTYNGVLWQFPESGGPAIDNRVSLYKETRYVGRGVLDWQVDRFNRLKAGGEFTRYAIDNYTSRLTDVLFDDVYREKPIRWNGFLEDVLDLGDVVIVGGLRYDYYNTRASRPFVYDTVGNRFAFPLISSYGGTEVRVGTDTILKGVFDPNNPTAQYVKDQSHDYISPHLQVSFPVTDRTNFRLSYAHQVQMPDFALLLGGINSDLEVRQGNTNQVYGADLDFGKTITFEFGISHAFSDDMVLDISAYNKDIISDPAARLVSLFDPNKNNNLDIRMLTNLDYGNVRGLDVRLDRRFGNLFNGNITYSFQQAKNTGSDPFTYTNYGSRIINLIAGGSQPPPQGILPTDNSRPHQLAGAFSLTFPTDWQRGSAVGTILRDVSLFSTFRYASGTAYSRCNDPKNPSSSEESILSIENCNAIFFGGINGARLPSTKEFNLRFTKGFRVGGLDLTAYADVRNLFNWQNVLQVFASNGTISNGIERELNFAKDSTDIIGEAIANNAAGANSSVILPADCSGWTGRGGVANCVYLKRAEQRYGNGDEVYTIDEQSRAINGLYDVARGVQTMTGTPRRARLGFEVSF